MTLVVTRRLKQGITVFRWMLCFWKSLQVWSGFVSLPRLSGSSPSRTFFDSIVLVICSRKLLNIVPKHVVPHLIWRRGSWYSCMLGGWGLEWHSIFWYCFWLLSMDLEPDSGRKRRVWGVDRHAKCHKRSCERLGRANTVKLVNEALDYEHDPVDRAAKTGRVKQNIKQMFLGHTTSGRVTATSNKSSSLYKIQSYRVSRSYLRAHELFAKVISDQFAHVIMRYTCGQWVATSKTTFYQLWCVFVEHIEADWVNLFLRV